MCEMAGYIRRIRIIFEKGPGDAGGPGYSSGNGGGPYDVQIRADSGGVPGATVLATSTNEFSVAGLDWTKKRNWVAQFTFNALQVTKNQAIHFVVRNKSTSSPSTNWISVNHHHSRRLWTTAELASTSWKRSPYFHTDGSTSLTTMHRLRGLIKNQGAWETNWSKIPTIEVDFTTSSGSTTYITKGQSILYPMSSLSNWAGLSSFQDTFPISNTNTVTYRFKPTGVDRQVGTEFYTKLIRLTSWQGPIYVDLSGPINANGSTGTVRYTFTQIDGPVTQISEGQGSSSTQPQVGWTRAASANASGPFYLRVGSTYSLKWSAVSGGTAYLTPHYFSNVPTPKPEDNDPVPGATTLNLKASFFSDWLDVSYQVNGTSATRSARGDAIGLPFLFRVTA